MSFYQLLLPKWRDDYTDSITVSKNRKRNSRATRTRKRQAQDTEPDRWRHWTRKGPPMSWDWPTCRYYRRSGKRDLGGNPSRTFWKYTSKKILSVIRMRWRMTIDESDTRRKSIPFYKNAFVKRTVPRSFFILMGKHSTWHDLYQTNLFILVWSISSIYLLSMGKYCDQGKQFLF